ncbi:caspase family protein [Streptomyces sp. NPDC127178]|uniref:caspase, EACC1-associated type n=1 Tax=unclassified Streptomyces TaxID=2593676 RepID=UPI003628C5CA
MRKRALIIAAQSYDNPRRQQLPGAGADARELSKVLRDPVVGAFEVETVVDETSHVIRLAIERFFREAESNDLLLLHISCHGQRNRRGELYFEVKDTDPATPSSTGIDSGFVARLMEESTARRIVLLLDCCYSGAFELGVRSGVPEVDVKRLFGGRGRVVLTASTSLQVAYENEIRSREVSEPSLFTSAVVRGLATGEADLDGDGLVSVQELFSYVECRVTEARPAQTPTLSVDDAQGAIYLATSPRGPVGPGDAAYGALSPLRDEVHRVLFALVGPRSEHASALARAARLPVDDVVTLADRLSGLGMDELAFGLFTRAGQARQVADVEALVTRSMHRDLGTWWLRWLVGLAARLHTSDIVTQALSKNLTAVTAYFASLPPAELILLVDSLRQHSLDREASETLWGAGDRADVGDVLSALCEAGRFEDAGRVLAGALDSSPDENDAARDWLVGAVGRLPVSDVATMTLKLVHRHVVPLTHALPPVDLLVLVDSFREHDREIEAAEFLRAGGGRPDLPQLLTLLGDSGRVEDIAYVLSRVKTRRRARRAIVMALAATSLDKRDQRKLLRGRRPISTRTVDLGLYWSQLLISMGHGAFALYTHGTVRTVAFMVFVVLILVWGALCVRWFRLCGFVNQIIWGSGVFALASWIQIGLGYGPQPTEWAFKIHNGVLGALAVTLFWLTHSADRSRAWCLKSVENFRRQRPAALFRLGSLSEKDGDIDSARRWYRRTAATGDAPSGEYPDAADEITADTTAADAVTALVRLESQGSPERAAAWCLRVINSAYTTSPEPTVLAAIELARIDAASSDTKSALVWYDYAFAIEQDSTGNHHRFLYWSAVEPTEGGPGVPRRAPGRLKSLARWAWALFHERPLAATALLESGLLQARQGSHADARARFELAAYFSDPKLQADLAAARRALPQRDDPRGDQALVLGAHHHEDGSAPTTLLT